MKKVNGRVNEQEFITDKGPERLEVEIIGSEPAITIPSEIPLKLRSSDDQLELTEGVTSDSLLTKLVNFQLQLRIVHWGTEDYPQHMASGSSYKDFDDVMDRLVEAYQGHNERVKFCDCFHIRNIGDLILEEWLEDTQSSIRELRELVQFNDLQNILDEAAGVVSKFKYLLTLK